MTEYKFEQGDLILVSMDGDSYVEREFVVLSGGRYYCIIGNNTRSLHPWISAKPKPKAVYEPYTAETLPHGALWVRQTTDPDKEFLIVGRDSKGVILAEWRRIITYKDLLLLFQIHSKDRWLVAGVKDEL